MDFHLVPRGTDRNYTGFLTKTIVYVATLIIFLLCKPIKCPGTNETMLMTPISFLPNNQLHHNPQMGQLS